LYVLKWYTPLEGIAGEIFRVTRDGEAIPYVGILAYRGAPSPDSYILLNAGESVSAEADLAAAFDFSKPGEYTIEFVSPYISSIARTEDEMAKTLDDLGPVQMPSNVVVVEIQNAWGE
jgi:peptidyl-Lys metalloendopeptidase